MCDKKIKKTSLFLKKQLVKLFWWKKIERISKKLLPIRQTQKDVFNLVFWQIE